MKVIRDPNAMRTWTRARRAEGKSVGLVPTMGALHAGHISLIEASCARDDATVVSIFVNPAQFAPHEDYDQYPRAFETDCRTIEELGGAAVYAPTTETMYPDGYATYVEVERMQEGLCGITRPHFFRGVATVVAKLFNAVEPDRAYFGMKDGQQTAIIKRMARDLDIGVEIVALPTVREADGLAMSSRNQYLTPDERDRAICISRSLFTARALLEDGERDAARLVEVVREGMRDVDIDYIELVDAEGLEPVTQIDRPVLLAVAAKIGKTRLIDNIQFEPVPSGSETSGFLRTADAETSSGRK